MTEETEKFWCQTGHYNRIQTVAITLEQLNDRGMAIWGILQVILKVQLYSKCVKKTLKHIFLVCPQNMLCTLT